MKEYAVFITDLYGRELYNNSGIQNRKQIDLATFSAGIYMIRIQTAGHSFIRKFINY
jgi:hypothetical protein